MDEATLAHYQARLLALLREHDDPNAIRQALRDDPRLAAHREAIDELDPHALRVAMQIVGKWGR